MLALTGLPTLFPKLVDARTFAERMFRVIFLGRLETQDCRETIQKPISDAVYPVRLNEISTQTIGEISGGYPYFIQFICREVFDFFLQKSDAGEELTAPADAIIRKLDTDFFLAGGLRRRIANVNSYMLSRI